MHLQDVHFAFDLREQVDLGASQLFSARFAYTPGWEDCGMACVKEAGLHVGVEGDLCECEIRSLPS